jgi:hypothetical protein
VVVDEALLITAVTGERLLIRTDRDTPLEVLATRHEEEIEAAIARAQFVRSSFECG